MALGEEHVREREPLDVGRHGLDLLPARAPAVADRSAPGRGAGLAADHPRVRAGGIRAPVPVPRHERELARWHHHMAELLRRSGRPGEADEHDRRSASAAGRWRRPSSGWCSSPTTRRASTTSPGGWLPGPCPGLHDANRAISLARKAVEREPTNGTFWGTLGVALYRTGDWDCAAEALEKSRELLPKEAPRFTYFRVMSRWRRGDRDAAARSSNRSPPGWVSERIVTTSRSDSAPRPRPSWASTTLRSRVERVGPRQGRPRGDPTGAMSVTRRRAPNIDAYRIASPTPRPGESVSRGSRAGLVPPLLCVTSLPPPALTSPRCPQTA